MQRKNNASDSISGAEAEAQAQQWLSQKGLTLVDRNYRCKVGEIDLVMRDGRTLVFVEVRYRRQNRFGGGLESVDWRKQRKLLLAAKHFLAYRRQYADLPCRFDVMAASAGDARGPLAWQWIQNAFGQ